MLFQLLIEFYMPWNQQLRMKAAQNRNPPKSKGKKSGSATRVIVILGIVTICTMIASWFTDDELKSKTRSAAFTTSKKKAHPRQNSSGKKPSSKTKYPSKMSALNEKTPEPLAEISSVAGPLVDGESVNTNRQAQLERFKREPVKGLAEQLLMMVIPSKKGEIVPPPPIDIQATPELEKEAQDMLERQGFIEDWDDENSIGIKERLEDLKNQWYTFKQDGGSFHEFLQKCIHKSNFDTKTLEEARAFDSENFQDGNLSDEEYLKLHEKVNKLLEIQGFGKIERPDEEPKIEKEKE